MRRRRLLCCLISVMLLIPSFSLAVSVQEILIGLTGDYSSYTAEISPGFQVLVPYNETRLRFLNDLLKHISLKIIRDGNISETAVQVDHRTAVSVIQEETQNQIQTVYSFDPDSVYLSSALPKEQESFSALFPDDFSVLTDAFGYLKPDYIRILDDVFDVLNSLPERYPDYAKTTGVKTKIKDVGVAVTKTVITFTKAETEKGILESLADSSDNSILKELFSLIHFTGRQQFVLYLDEGSRLLKVNYSGQAGIGEDERKVTLQWKAVRESDIKYDDVVLKTPAVSGKNKNNVSLIRRESREETEGCATAMLSATYNRTRNKVSDSFEISAEVSADEKVSGKFEIISGIGKKGRKTVRIEPDFDYKSATEWKGDLRIVSMMDDIILKDMMLNIALDKGTNPIYVSRASEVNMDEMEEAPRNALLESLQRKTSECIIRSLMQLPADDLLFLTEGLETNIWQGTLQ